MSVRKELYKKMQMNLPDSLREISITDACTASKKMLLSRITKLEEESIKLAKEFMILQDSKISRKYTITLQKIQLLQELLEEF